MHKVWLFFVSNSSQKVMKSIFSSFVLSRRLSDRTFLRFHGTSINSKEVEKFSKVGSDWWNKNSTSGTGPLHAMNPTRVNFIRNCIAEATDKNNLPATEQLKGLEILDVGCGGGLLAEALARLGAKVTAIDPSIENIKVASRHSKIDPLTSTIEYKHSTIEEVSSSGTTFDVVCSLEVLEHVDQPLSFIRSCQACVRPGGHMFLSTINRTAKSYAMTILGAEYLLRMLPVGTHEWSKFITPEELIAMVTATSPVRQVNIKGLVLDVKNFPPKWILSSTDHDVNYILHAAFPMAASAKEL